MPKILQTKREPTDKEMQEYAALLAAYMHVNANVNSLGKQLKEQKEKLKAFTEKFGVKDGNGNLIRELRHGTDYFRLVLQKRTTTELKEDCLEVAKKMFKSRPAILERIVVESEEYVDADAIAALLMEGEITVAEAKKLASESVSYSFVPQKSKKKFADTDEQEDG